MMPFNRFIRAADKWAQTHSDYAVLAQIGSGEYIPRNMRWTRMLSPGEYRKAVEASAIIVSHAGMGSYFFAMEMRKPIVMLPRHASKQEHTTDHQVHTVKWLCHKPGVYVAISDDELPRAIDQALLERNLEIDEFQRFAPEPFVTKIREFLLR
jgi:UDP-N-acetylglucosamine transferase subunit ALG13